jgi:hypothetical protein
MFVGTTPHANAISISMKWSFLNPTISMYDFLYFCTYPVCEVEIWNPN